MRKGFKNVPRDRNLERVIANLTTPDRNLVFQRAARDSVADLSDSFTQNTVSKRKTQSLFIKPLVYSLKANGVEAKQACARPEAQLLRC